MFDIGFQELIIIFLVALLVFGPKKLPEVGRTLGKWISEFRRSIDNAKMQMEIEFRESQKGAGEEAKMSHGLEEEKTKETHASEGRRGKG